jgi:hypothetical protein
MFLVQLFFFVENLLNAFLVLFADIFLVLLNDLCNDNCGAIHILDSNYIQLYKFPDLVSCLFVFVLHVLFSFQPIDWI